MSGWRHLGVLAALAAAALFGAGTPVAKLLLGQTSPWLLAGLLYLGSGLGLFLLRLVRRRVPVMLSREERSWLGGAIVFGGMIGPALLMWGLAHMPASGASLLLNAEGVLTALIAWFVFRENFDRRIALGMGFIVAGALILAWPEESRLGETLPTLAILGACLAWAIDNNMTRRVSLADAGFIAMLKGLAAGDRGRRVADGAGAGRLVVLRRRLLRRHPAALDELPHRGAAPHPQAGAVESAVLGVEVAIEETNAPCLDRRVSGGAARRRQPRRGEARRQAEHRRTVAGQLGPRCRHLTLPCA